MNETRRGAEPESKLTFEEALARLEEIVAELEGQTLTLEETLARYEEGARLVRECTGRLDAAEQRIRTIQGVQTSEEIREGGEGKARDETPR